MSDLLQWLTSYLNLSKLTAITVPGIVAALALLLVYGPIPCGDSTTCPLCSNLKGQNAKGNTVTASANAKAIPNQILTSSSNWLKMPPGQQSTLLGTLQKFVALVPNSELAGDLNTQISAINDNCGALPIYVVNGSRPTKPEGPGSTNGTQKGSDKAKYEGEGPRDIAQLLQNLNLCYLTLASTDGAIQKQKTALDLLTSQTNSDFSSLSSELIAAEKSANHLEVQQISRLIQGNKIRLAEQNQIRGLLSQADTAMTALQAQVSSMRNTVLSNVNAQPTPPASTTAVTTDLITTVSQNFVKFLIFSLILGVILDPIQRGLVSFVGPRRRLFELFNVVYGSTGDGEIRFGDRRLAPWTSPAGGVVERAERPAWVSHVFKDDENIYDPDYAIGAGFLTQSEYNGLFDDFYRQSQITTGLIIPVLILAVCLGIRMYCCNTLAVQAAKATQNAQAVQAAQAGAAQSMVVISTDNGIQVPSARKASTTAPNIVAPAVVVPMKVSFIDAIGWTCLGFAISSLLVLLATAASSSSAVWYALEPLHKLDRKRKREHVGSSATGRSVLRMVMDDRSKAKLSVFPFIVVIGVCVLVAIGGLFGVVAAWRWPSGESAEWLSWIAVGTLASFPLPLWIGGVDRLHKFYSDVQARISGVIRKQHENTEQKVIDLLTDDLSRRNFVQRLNQEKQRQDDINDILQAIENVAASKQPPATPPSPQPPSL